MFQLLLLDFGASREYSKEFMDKYVQVLKGACDGDRNIVLNVSKEIGFLTGYESKVRIMMKRGTYLVDDDYQESINEIL